MALPRDNARNVMQAPEWAVAGVQNLAIGAASVASTALSSAAKAARIVSTVDCYVMVDPAASVTSSNGSFLPAGVVEYVSLASIPAGTAKIAVITATSGVTGSANLTEIV